MPLTTTAYAGHGKTTAENAGGLLNEFLPDDLGLVIIPARVTRRQAGLKQVISWLEGEVGDDGTIPTDDLIAALLARKDYEGDDGETKHDDIVLVMLYDENVTDDVELARAAHEAGIRVVDLCAANDDLLLDDADITFTEAEAEAEEETAAILADPETMAAIAEAEAETAPFDGGTRVAGTEPVKEAVDRATAAGVAAAKAHDGKVDVTPPADSLVPVPAPYGLDIRVSLQLDEEAVSTIARAIVAAMNAGPAEAVSVAPEPGEKLATVTDINGPASDTPQPGTSAYYYNDDACTYRPARGKARDGEKKVYLTEEGVRQITARKLLA